MITKDEKVQGGVACVGDTRIPVWYLETWRRRGHSDKQLLAKFAALTTETLAEAIAYVASNKDEIEEAIKNTGPAPKPKPAA